MSARCKRVMKYFIITFIALLILAVFLRAQGYRLYLAYGESMLPVISDGSFIVGRLGADYDTGDIIIFYYKYKFNRYKIVHRVIYIDDDYILCRGDNNGPHYEMIEPDAVIGKVLIIVNYGNVMETSIKK